MSGPLAKCFAWGVHAITAFGAIAGLMAGEAIVEQQWKSCFAWLMAATAIDSFDGVLARYFRVKEVVPEFDGALLDNIVDFLTYVVVPAMFFMYMPGLLPKGWVVFAACSTVFASAYQFCQSDAKTDDHYFKGFPSYWNIVALYLFLFEFRPWVNFAVIIVLALLVFVPIKYLYPSRTPRFRGVTLTFALFWAVAMIVLLVQHPHISRLLVWASMAFVAYYVAASAWLTLTIARPARAT